MEYTKKRRYTTPAETTDLADIYQHDLQMYDFPPQGEMLLAEFKQLGMERLKLLRHVENNGMRSDLKTLEERKQNLKTALEKDDLKYFAHLLYGKGCSSCTEICLQYRKKDHISHYVLRLSCCRDPDKEKWFINQEVELFRLRFSSLDKEGIQKLLSMHNINCEQLTQTEKDEIREQLHSSTTKITNIDTTDFYKVPFHAVIDLIKSRKVYITQGVAIIPYTRLIYLFINHFKNNLVDSMPHARSCLSSISEDERLISYLSSLHCSFSGTARVVWTTNATPIDKLDELSRTSYPLCMRVLHEALKTQHHLRNSGRIQYGLFMKGIGVTLEDTLRFWKTEFSHKIDPDKFDKQYAYAIRHIFGKEGKQTNYTPLGCGKIFSSAVGVGEYHGCPYKHMDNASLKQKLFSYGLPAASISEIADLAKEGSYLLACTSYFNALHDRLPDKPIIHPNGYFIESRAILAKDNTEEVEGKEKLSQNGKLSDGVSTPKRLNGSFSTPLRNTSTPSRSVDRFNTPSRSVDRFNTPSRKTVIEKASVTPVRAIKVTPKRIETDLDINEIAELINEDM